jgi:Ca2+-binding RTX toxin-like protein
VFVVDVSADGNRVAFESDATGLVQGDQAGTVDLFVKDLRTGEIWRVNQAADGTRAAGDSHFGDLSADGSVVAFSSDAPNLVRDDTNGGFDVFVARLDASAGRTLVGTAGRDALAGGGHGDHLNGASGDDVARGFRGDDRLFGGRGIDLLDGGPGKDHLHGGHGSDLLIGGAGRDSLWGDDGADVLVGGPGRDVLRGGPGADLFVVSVGGRDRVADYDPSEGDRVLRLDPLREADLARLAGLAEDRLDEPWSDPSWDVGAAEVLETALSILGMARGPASPVDAWFA